MKAVSRRRARARGRLIFIAKLEGR